MTLIALPAFTDHYIWMLHDGLCAVVVDPGESEPVIAALDAQQLVLAAILVTHHHADLVGGVDARRERQHARVYGPKPARIREPHLEAPAQIRQSLARPSLLPGETRAGGGLEYRRSTLTFAFGVGPNNPDLAEYIDRCDARHGRGRATLRSSIARERLVSPFLRCGRATLTHGARKHGASCEDPVAVLAALR